MTKMSKIALLVLSAGLVCAAQTAPKPNTPSNVPSAQQSARQSGNLETVLNLMDQTAANFRNVQANFVWDQYTSVIDSHDEQAGTMYFRRTNNGVEMAADITKPDNKYVLFINGKVQLYQPKIDQVTNYNAGKNKAAFESFLVLGFGGRGHDLEKQFAVKYAGTEKVGDVNTYRLDLTPKDPKVQNMFQTITLWIDQQRGISVQQKFMQGSGDYRLAKYFDIKQPSKLPDSVFKLKTTNRTKFVSPQ